MLTRRGFVAGVGVTAALSTSRALAEALVLTPEQTEGPFYPDHLPLDTDNDLILINQSAKSAVGDITHVSGRVLDASGKPLLDAMVEIWQVDGNGVYLHTQSDGAKRDANFQGYGRFLTGQNGEYAFRTVKPVPYPGRTPHIHFAISRGGKRVLTTQMYIKDHPGNEKDGIYRGIKDKAQRESVTIEFKPLEKSKAGELTAAFDIVMGLTPEQS